ncbi:MAG: CBS domain-containing protein [Roseburia sp.]
MNILFFLTPKVEVVYIKESDSMRQVLEKLEYHGYSAVPMLSEDGKYIGTITEGDLLWEMKDRDFPDLKELEEVPISSIRRRRDNLAVNVQADMEDLFEKVSNQNFVPVVDDHNIFSGIVTRKDVLLYLAQQLKKSES